MLDRLRFERFIKHRIEQPLKYIHELETCQPSQYGGTKSKYTLQGKNLFDSEPPRTKHIFLRYRKTKNPVGYNLLNGMEYLCMDSYKLKPGINYDSMQKGYVAEPNFEFPSLMTPQDTPENYKPIYEKLYSFPKRLPKKLVNIINNRYKRAQFLVDKAPLTGFASSGLATALLSETTKTPWIGWAACGAAVGFNLDKVLRYFSDLKTVRQIETKGTNVLYRLAKQLPRK